MATEFLNEPLPEDYRGCFDKEFIGFWDLGGKDVTITIASVKVGKLRKPNTEPDAKKDKKPILFFKGTDKGMILNATNAATLASLYGNKPAEWVGKRVTLYATTTSAFGKMVDCIRIRTKVPLESVKDKKETA